MDKKERFKRFISYFSKNMPDAATELRYVNPYELLVAVMLSAQCTDKRVNITTPVFFKKFPEIKDLAKARFIEVQPIVKSISYPNSKTRHLIGMAKMVVKEFEGEIPSDVDDLQKLPGVGRKTANVIASVVYKQPKMPVDTHVFRVSARIGLTNNAKTPLAAEKQLVKFIPEEKIILAHHWLILHGRYVCTARNPKCEDCPINGICKYYKIKVSEFGNNTLN